MVNIRIDHEEVVSMRKNSIKSFEDYKKTHGPITDDEIFSMPVLTAVGYFLQVHSKDPEAAVRKYVRLNSISNRKGNELKAIVGILK